MSRATEAAAGRLRRPARGVHGFTGYSQCDVLQPILALFPSPSIVLHCEPLMLCDAECSQRFVGGTAYISEGSH